jgi:hypothetical protein
LSIMVTAKAGVSVGVMVRVGVKVTVGVKVYQVPVGVKVGVQLSTPVACI